MPAYEWLKAKHPIWEVNHEEWARRERLLRGGNDVAEIDLEKFEWEEAEGSHFKNRKKQAVYPAFGEAFTRTLMGHVLRERPEAGENLSFGGLGTIDRSEGQRDPSKAELVYYNVNGTGGDGQQFWQWVSSVFERAGATGLRWVMAEAPPWSNSSDPTDADVIAGQRPYAMEFSPRSVTNWLIERGQLQWCVIVLREDTRTVANGELQGKANEKQYYLLVHEGYEGLGDEFKGGGWWKFDSETKPVPENNHGTWQKTNGEIPMSLAVWQWEDPTAVIDDDQEATALPLARSGTTNLDNLSVAYMNAVSAWRSNLWRAAGGPTILLGVDTESWKVARAQWMSGASLIGVPRAEGSGVAPSVDHSSAGAVTSEAFGPMLEHMTAEAERMMIQLATSTPDSSGRSKEAGFSESKAPRLTLLAENIESFLNTLLRFFELRFGIAQPTAYVVMPREFDLAPLEEDIREFFDTFRRTQLRSATLETEAVIKLAEKKGLVNDENRDKVKGELKESARASATAGAQEGGFLADIFGDGGGAE